MKKRDSVLDLITKSSEPAKPSKQYLQDKPRLRPAAYRLPDTTIEGVRNLAWWKRVRVQDMVNDALTSYIETAELEHGPIPPRHGERRHRVIAGLAEASAAAE